MHSGLILLKKNSHCKQKWAFWPPEGRPRIVLEVILGYNIRILVLQKMMKNTPKYLANFLVFSMGIGLFFLPARDLKTFLLAQEGSPETPQVKIQTTSVQPAGTSHDSGAESAFVPGDSQNSQDENMAYAEKSAKRAEFLQRIKDQLQSAQSDYISINRNVHDTRDKLLDVQEERLTLQKQLSILNRQIEETVTVTQNVLMQIEEKENQIEILKNEIKLKDLEVENQKKMLSEYLTVLYEQESSMHDTTDENHEVNVAKLLLSDKAPEEALRELHYFNILEATGHDIFEKLETLLKQQQTFQIIQENSRNKLEMLYRELQDQQDTLAMQQEAKTQLLEETKGQEVIYQQLLEQTQQEQGQVLLDIQSLRDNLEFIQKKIEELGDKFNPDDYKGVLDKDITNVYEYIKEHQNSGFAPQWPVSPSRGISAYFHDESYRRAMGVAHQAIDIRALQSTPIHAPTDGVVYKTRDNGYGYSYIILAHGGGFMTVYGHVSEIRVTEGEKIKQGQVIGLSGAMPGTKGAGLMTTGPHLHFEVLKGGKHVDPLDYLPLSYLPLSTLPDKYLSRITGDAAKVSRTSFESDAATSDVELLQRVEAGGEHDHSLDAGNGTEGFTD